MFSRSLVDSLFRLNVMHFYQFGFRRQKSTGTVDTSKVYSGGKHFLGPDYEFKVFKANAHFLDLDNFGVFTRDKLEVCCI